uniref:Pectinesterase inhibitor domain-containing protein n=2 Tax=Nymphaea colorata TaxID=210225 RepID=A0A5K1ASJ5_9MAGN
MAHESSPVLALKLGTILLVLSLAIYHVSAAGVLGFGGGGGSGGSSGSGNCTNNTNNGGAIEFIRKSCNFTLYPAVCFSSLSGYAASVQQSHTQLAKVAINVSLSNAQVVHRFVDSLSVTASNINDSRALMALKDCRTTFSDGISWMQQSLVELGILYTGNFRFHMSNILTWMSAALTDEQTCIDGFEGVSTIPGLVLKAVVANQASAVGKVTSNALALVNYLNPQRS